MSLSLLSCFSLPSCRLLPALLLLFFVIPLQAESTGGAFKHHTVGVIAGVTHSDSENNYNVGVEYEYFINASWGVGATYERTPEAHYGDGVSVYYVAGYWHPDSHWRLGVGLGEERIHGSHGYEEDLVRATVSYDFHVGKFGVAPTLSFDEVDGEIIEVFGVALNRRF